MHAEVAARQKNMALEERLQIVEAQLKEYQTRSHIDAESLRDQVREKMRENEITRLQAHTNEESLRIELEKLHKENAVLGVNHNDIA